MVADSAATPGSYFFNHETTTLHICLTAFQIGREIMDFQPTMGEFLK